MKKLSKLKKIMKEVIKNKIKKYFKIIIKIIIGFVLLLILSFILVAIYSFTFERDRIVIDRYNFEQLEKAKHILESIPDNDKYFYSLKEFNKKYNGDIKPIKNCYYIRNYNGNEKYIFGFKLESLIYIYIYRTTLFAYPKYDLPFEAIHFSGGTGDINKAEFRYTVSKPCEE